MALFILALLQLVTATGGQQCLLASNGSRPLPVFERESGDNAFDLKAISIQAIITSYRFNCCGVISGWGTFIERPSSFQSFSISFQVWRPHSFSPEDTDGCYNLTGVNSFRDVLITSNQRRELLNVTIPFNERISVQPWDVMGFSFVRESNNNRKRGISVSDDPSYTQELVWFETGRDLEPDQTKCPGSGSFTNIAPLITATVVTTTCAPATTTGSLTLQATPVSRLSGTPSATATKNSIQPSASPSTASDSESIANLGMIIGVGAGGSILLLVIISIVCLISICVIIRKKRSKLSCSKVCAVKEKEGTKYIPSSTITKNEAYGKFATADQTENVYDGVYTTQLGSAPVTQDNDYDDVYHGNDYYINEGLGGVSTTPGDYHRDPSIPATENQAYTSVSANTERAEDEEMYDCLY